MGIQWSKRMLDVPLSSEDPDAYLNEIRSILIEYRHLISCGTITYSKREAIELRIRRLFEIAERVAAHKYRYQGFKKSEFDSRLEQWRVEYKKLAEIVRAHQHYSASLNDEKKERLLDPVDEEGGT